MRKDYLKIFVFILIAYGIPWLCGATVGDKINGVAFTNCLSAIPTVALVVGELIVDRKKITMFHVCYLLAGVGMGLCMLTPWFGVEGAIVENIVTYYYMALSVCLTIYCALYGERNLVITRGGKKSIGTVFMALIVCLVGFHLLQRNFNIGFYAMLIPSVVMIFFQCIPMIGEEYAWRGTVQPILQRKFGKRLGILILTIIWEIWHACMWIRLSPLTQLSDNLIEVLCLRFMLVLSIAIFLAWAYLRTENVWVCATIHWIYNATAASGVGFRINFGWVLFFVFCLSLLFTGEFRSHVKEDGKKEC